MNHLQMLNQATVQDDDRFFALPLLAGLAITAPFWAPRRCCPPFGGFYPAPYPLPTPFPYPYPSPYYYYNRRPFIY